MCFNGNPNQYSVFPIDDGQSQNNVAVVSKDVFAAMKETDNNYLVLEVVLQREICINSN